MPKEKAHKNNKTARVLSLLTDPTPPPEGADAEGKEGGAKRKPLSAPAMPATHKVEDEQVSQSIRNALEAELLGEDPGPSPAEPAAAIPASPSELPVETAPATAVPPAAAAPSPLPQAETPPPVSAPEPPASAAPVPAETAAAEPVSLPESPAEKVSATINAAPLEAPPEPPAMAEAPSPAATASGPPPPPTPAGLSYVNVMQALVEEKVDKYIKLFGLCTCPRCKIDVMALALTNLPAKYVVVKEQELIPMLTVYEGRYNAAIVAQVMGACKKVMENPRHDL